MSAENSLSRQDAQSLALMGIGVAANLLIENPLVKNVIAPAIILYGAFRLLWPKSSLTPA